MKQNLKQWLSVLCMGMTGLSATAWADAGTPVDCGTVECEAIREMRSLFTAESGYFAEHDVFTLSLASAGFAPAACPNGSRAPVPGAGWVSGCNFSYKVTGITPHPSPGFTAVAQGVAGTPSAGITLQIGTHPVSGRLFWLERQGVRRYVDSAECLPAQSFTCEAQLREARSNLNYIHVVEQSYFAERDQYSTNLPLIGFVPEGCSNGTRAAVPDASWVAGCRFIYKVTLNGTTGFTATAKAVTGATEGSVLTLTESGQTVIAPSYPASCQ
ncbi:hypothetical protein D7W82_12255 [Corallococcus sp. CA049B]|uniref:hypothetical protein n=1 Tax=Corallococcus sp. CA049B TaxID=2316730 RepID=UPI000EA3818D|nr:hypothetical protein [Corallococcus sp. CA049B]RKG87832.1 hypothetical protein D7W82_12255 [Corallococcus sp. CA049B]